MSYDIIYAFQYCALDFLQYLTYCLGPLEVSKVSQPGELRDAAHRTAVVTLFKGAKGAIRGKGIHKLR